MAVKIEETIQWVVIGGIVYLAYQAAKKLGEIGQGAGEMGSQVAEIGDTMPDPSGATWAQWYDPTQRTVWFYWLTFPTGDHHWVWSSGVQVDGSFVYSDGYKYRIGVDKAGGLRAYYWS